MRWLNSKVSTVGIFLAATALLIVYLLSLRWNVYLPVAVFWMAIALMLCTIIYQSLHSQLTSRYATAILLEIAIACLVFHLIYQIPHYNIVDWDAYMDMASVKGILSSGFVGGDPRYFSDLSYFPMIHVLGTQLCVITNIDLLSVVKWFPSLFDVALILLLYLFIRSIFNSDRIALLSALLFASLETHLYFSSLFIRETIALVLLVACLYLYFSAKTSAHPVIYYALAIICLLGTVVAHHLSSFMLLIFLLIHFLVGRAFELPFLRRTYFGHNVAGEKITSSFVLIVFIAIFAFWIYIVISPLYDLATFIQDVFTPSRWGFSTYGEITGTTGILPHTFQGYVLFYGFYSFLLIFGTILLYGILPRIIYHRIEAFSFTVFLFICGIGGFMSLYLVPMGMVPYPERFMTFGWLLAFAPLVAIILGTKNKLLIGVGIFLLCAFMLHNIYQIPPTVWDAKAEGVQIAPSEEDYTLAKTFDFSSGEIAAHPINLLAIYDVSNNLGENSFSNIDLSEYDWVILHKEVLRLEQRYYPELVEAIAEMRQLEKEGSLDRDKIYQSSNLSVFKLRE